MHYAADGGYWCLWARILFIHASILQDGRFADAYTQDIIGCRIVEHYWRCRFAGIGIRPQMEGVDPEYARSRSYHHNSSGSQVCVASASLGPGKLSHVPRVYFFYSLVIEIDAVGRTPSRSQALSRGCLVCLIDYLPLWLSASFALSVRLHTFRPVFKRCTQRHGLCE